MCSAGPIPAQALRVISEDRCIEIRRAQGAGSAHHGPLGQGQAELPLQIAQGTLKERRAVAGMPLDWTYRPTPRRSWRAIEKEKAMKDAMGEAIGQVYGGATAPRS